MSAINASKVKLYVNTTDANATFTSGANLLKVTDITSTTLNLETDLIDVTTKDNAGRADYIEGLKSSSLDFEGIMDFASAANIESLFASKKARTFVSWRLTDEDDNGVGTDNGGNRYEGIGIITALSLDAPLEEAGTFSGTITVKGEVNKFNTDEATA